jgi:hypothetical protein
MRVYTQSNVNHTIPDQAQWLPCITTQSVAHDPAVVQPMLITHIAAIQHYQHAITALLNQPIQCVGRHTAERLRDMGFEHIRCRLRAADVRIDSATTWLRGEIFHRDFSKESNITTIQTYHSVLHHANIEKLLSMQPHSVHVYSAAVLQVLQTRSWPHTTLYTVPSAPADKNLWHTVTEFDPNLAQDAAPAEKLLTNSAIEDTH